MFDFMPNQNGFFLSYLMLVPVLSIQYKFLTAASFLTAVLYVEASVWILNKSPKRHLPRGFLFRSIHSPPFLSVFLSYFSL